MKVITKRLGMALGLLILMTACGTSPSYQYHLLRAETPAALPSSTGPSIGVRPIGLPEYLSRLELIYNQHATGLTVSGTARWAGPLADGIKRTLDSNRFRWTVPKNSCRGA